MKMTTAAEVMAGVSSAIALQAPRTLNDRVGCQHSSL